MYKFTGTDTRKRTKYEAEAETVIELYNQLVSNGTISTTDGDPLDNELMTRHNKTWEDFDDDFEKFVTWSETVEALSDEDILDVISGQNGNAYYQTIIVC